MKNKYLIDSNVLMDFFKKKSHAIETLTLLKEDGRLYISSLTLMELQAGWDDKHSRFYFPRLQELADVKEITKEICMSAGKLLRDYQKKGVLLQPVDTLIAVTSIVNDFWMVTYNTRHFEPIKELKLYKNL